MEEDEFMNGIDDDFGGDMGSDIPPPMERHNQLLQTLMNFEPYLKQLENRLLGVVWDEEEEKYIQATEPLVTKEGAVWITNILRTYIRDNNIITYLNEEEFNNIEDDLIDVIYPSLTAKYFEFKVKDNANLRVVTNLMYTGSKLVLLGSGDGKASKILTQTTSRTENVSSPRSESVVRPSRPTFMQKVNDLIGGRN